MNGLDFAFLRVGAPSIYPVSQVFQALFEKLALGTLNTKLVLQDSVENLIQDLVMFLRSFACHQNAVKVGRHLR